MPDLPTRHSSECRHSLQERDDHREWIAGCALTLLSVYWRDDDPNELTAAIGKLWADVLEGIPQEYLERACVRYARDEPRRRPTPGAIYQIAREMMPPPRVVRSAPLPPEPERIPCSPEVAAEIIREVGYSPKRLGGDNG